MTSTGLHVSLRLKSARRGGRNGRMYGRRVSHALLEGPSARTRAKITRVCEDSSKGGSERKRLQLSDAGPMPSDNNETVFSKSSFQWPDTMKDSQPQVQQPPITAARVPLPRNANPSAQQYLPLTARTDASVHESTVLNIKREVLVNNILGANAVLPKETSAVTSFLLGLTRDLSDEMGPALIDLGCSTQDDLNALSLMDPNDEWEFFFDFLKENHSASPLQRLVIRAGLQKLRTSRPVINRGLKRPLTHHLHLFQEYGMKEGKDIDALCAVKNVWNFAGAELVRKGLTMMEWLVVRDGLKSRMAVAID